MQMFRVAQCFKEQYYAALLGERGFIHFLFFFFLPLLYFSCQFLLTHFDYLNSQYSNLVKQAK